MQKERFSRVCESCYHNCKEYVMYSKNDCVNYKLSPTAQEYWRLIKESNMNIRKMCDKHGLSTNIMLNMLNEKQTFGYKYKICLEEYLFEKEEYLPYILDEVANG